MIKHTLVLSQRGSRLSLKNDQCFLTLGDGTTHSFPAEDIGLVLLETPAVTLSGAILARIARLKGVVVHCDEKGSPCGILLPLEGNQEMADRFEAQACASIPLKKRLWQKVVKRKLENQAALLSGESKAKILSLTKKVGSGDPENREGGGAKIYWSRLFSETDIPGKKFTRRRDGIDPNPLLNFGYMVFRAAMARAIVCAGLSPFLGIHHSGGGNPFCLADDLMEPYRPLVDRAVLVLCQSGRPSLDPLGKKSLLELLPSIVDGGDFNGPVWNAMMMTATSLGTLYLDHLEGRRSKIPPGELKKIAGKIFLPKISIK